MLKKTLLLLTQSYDYAYEKALKGISNMKKEKG